MTRSLRWLALLVFTFTAAACPGTTTVDDDDDSSPTETICDDGVDEDEDGLIDCEDDDCALDEACSGDDDDDDDDDDTAEVDEDGDGWSVKEDCDDADPTSYPDAEELCDGVDNDCDGVIPEDELDGDGDGFATCAGDCDDADPALSPEAEEICNGIDDDCDGGVGSDEVDDDFDGYAECEGDCDDADGVRNPGAEEQCNAIDDDCDGVVPEDELDADLDSFAGCAGDCDDLDEERYPGAFETCNGLDDDCNGEVPEIESDADEDGFLACAEDCDDDRPDANPDAVEICNGLDDDCDEALPADESDADSDGQLICEGDCDDTNTAVALGAEEICDELDNNCDALVDEGFPDTDGNGIRDCLEEDLDGDGWLPFEGDCDNTNPLANPDGIEVCDGADNDCNGLTDEGTTTTYWPDEDEDGWGDEDAPLEACSLPEGFVEQGEDCDDLDGLNYPTNIEVCDGQDNDCDDESDEGVTTEYFLDSDGDGFGFELVSVEGCEAPPDFVENDEDCDDLDPNNFPDNEEVCDGSDNDCDDAVDEGVLTSWYPDSDGDGFGDPGTVIEACAAPPGSWTEDATDCDDGEPSVNPAAEEVCNSVDDNCDGGIDEGVLSTFYLDADSDGFGDAGSTIEACVAPGGYVSLDTDCDDDNPDTFPTAPEICDAQDNDCDGAIPADEDDDDADGQLVCAGDCNDLVATTYFGAPELCNAVDDDCDGVIMDDELDDDLDGMADCEGDCVDSNPTIYDGAPEICDGLDNDCDTAIPGVEADSDVDGSRLCQGDCDDFDPARFPGNPEICDRIDNDCLDGIPAPEQDVDTDGMTPCEGDCDDTNPVVFDGNPEVCDTFDNDCDTLADEGLSFDSDGDGIYSPISCLLPNNDCNDSDPTVFPGAAEIGCDGTDQDCDGSDFAPEDSYGDIAECTRAQVVGSLAVGEVESVVGRLPQPGGSDWFTVSFPPSASRPGGGTPQLTFTNNPGDQFRFEVLVDCAGTQSPCSTGTPAGNTAWSFTDNASPAGSGAYSSNLEAWPSTVYVKVTRIGGGLSCDQYEIGFDR